MENFIEGIHEILVRKAGGSLKPRNIHGCLLARMIPNWTSIGQLAMINNRRRSRSLSSLENKNSLEVHETGCSEWRT
ncbi:hypothetical protein I7I50_03605 [Histoplasma capsulatum G186AR]|uniref:Uncharacterized protein n=1 Tax=Ajellomyces capsulatus TaxID=5037 RepID=A0A8H7YKQ2_AJECA|nr:hypothetical protein I7I52_04512 [Histoplasma capsulatum]QSS74707.1 hypothetical protein I7I50_03605 [Histoplasma capsulatum G186AR]